MPSSYATGLVAALAYPHPLGDLRGRVFAAIAVGHRALFRAPLTRKADLRP